MPAPQIQELCRDVPVNPAAARIGAEYLTIPGCDGVSSGTQPVADPAAEQPVVNQQSSSISPSQPSPPPASLSSPSNNGPSDVASSDSGSLDSGSSDSGLPSTGNSSTSSTSTTGSSSDPGSGETFTDRIQSTITRYGQVPAGEEGTDGDCQSNQGSCGINPQYGYTAAASEFWYFNGAPGVGQRGSGGGGGPGLACGTCWKVWSGNDFSGKPIPGTPIVVLITNECATQPPGEAPNLCSQTSWEAKNDKGAGINVDLCINSAATQAFWGGPPWGSTTGETQQVSCSEWCGMYANGTKSGGDGCQTEFGSPPPADTPQLPRPQ